MDAYKADCVELRDLCVEAETLSEPPELFSHVLGVARLGAVDDQSAAHLGRHGSEMGLTEMLV